MNDSYPTIANPYFLAELKERARRYGWLGDYTEVASFVTELYREAGIEVKPADLEPYEN